MAAAFTILFQKIASVIEWLGKLAVAVFKALWDFIRDAATWPVDQFLQLAVEAVEAIDVSSVSGKLGIFSQIPAGVLEVMGAVGAGTCFAIIGSALAIRFALQLIPFTRLGS
jgi:hypothetical protein